MVRVYILQDIFNLLQWNCQGLRAKKDELLQLINDHEPSIVALQEIMINNQSLSIPGYDSVMTPGHHNHRAHGGAAVLIHKDIPYKSLQFESKLQHVSVIATLPEIITISSLYIPGSQQIKKEDIEKLIANLKRNKFPILLMGDFNAWHSDWGCRETRSRGKLLRTIFEDESLNILNTGEATCITNMTTSAIDLSVASITISPLMSWYVLESPFGSDHYPIKITMDTPVDTPSSHTYKTKYNFKKADWFKFFNHKVWFDLPNICDVQQSLDSFYSCIKIALDDSVPKYTTTKYIPKPWWDIQLKEAYNEREAAFKKFKNKKSVSNLIVWKRKRALFNFLKKKCKSESWQRMCNDMTPWKKKKKIYENIKK